MTQAVIDDTNPDLGAGSGDDALDVDALVSNYKQEMKPADSGQQFKPEDVSAIASYVKQQQEAEQQKELDSAIGAAVSTIKEGLGDLKLSDKMIKRYMNGMASETDQKDLVDAFAARAENPKAWAAAQKKVLNEIKEEFAVDQEVTEDREALVAAVRGTSQSKPKDETPNFAAMSDAEFNAYKMKLRMEGRKG